MRRFESRLPGLQWPLAAPFFLRCLRRSSRPSPRAARQLLRRPPRCCSHCCLLPLLDLFVPNELEACAIAGVQPGDIDGAIAALSKQVGGCVVVTRGAKGAVIAARGMDTRSVSAPVVEAIDAVGAGDAFKAGLLACFVSGTPLHEAAAYGAVTGSMNVTRRGACVDPPRPSEVAAFAAAHGVAPEVVAALQVQQEVASAPPSPPATSGEAA